MKKRRKYFRKCGICGKRDNQSNMIRTNESNNGWMCNPCYSNTHMHEIITEEIDFKKPQNMERLDVAISIFTDDFSFDENGIMKITREAAKEIAELLKEYKNSIET